MPIRGSHSLSIRQADTSAAEDFVLVTELSDASDVITAVAWSESESESENGFLATGSYDRMVRVYDVTKDS